MKLDPNALDRFDRVILLGIQNETASEILLDGNVAEFKKLLREDNAQIENTFEENDIKRRKEHGRYVNISSIDSR